MTQKDKKSYSKESNKHRSCRRVYSISCSVLMFVTSNLKQNGAEEVCCCKCWQFRCSLTLISHINYTWLQHNRSCTRM